MKLGFIGIGLMGAGVVRNLIKAGHEVTVWDRFEEPAAEMVTAGAKLARTPEEATQHGIVFSMLAHDDAIQSTLIDPGWLDKSKKPLVHVNLSTISVKYARELTDLHAAAGIAYVASPVFGRPDSAAAGTLNLIVGGPDSAITPLLPALEAFSGKVYRVGSEPFQANLVKIAGNMMIASAIESMAEAAALGAAHGVDGSMMLDIYLEALFPSPVYRGYSAFIRRRDYEPVGFKLPLGLKDVRLALEAGEHAHVPLPVAGVVRDSLIQAIANGYGEKDWSSLAETSFIRAGLAKKP